MAWRYSAFLAFLSLSLLCLTGQEDYCSSEDIVSTANGEKCKKNLSETPIIHTSAKTMPMKLLMSGQTEKVVVSDSKDIFISIKTTQKYHETRLPPVLLTWIQTVQPEQIHIVTDGGINDWILVEAMKQGIKVTNTTCPANHQRKSLCCKSGVEYEQYYLANENTGNYRWFCHFDDDVYVNVPVLTATLSEYNSTEPVYFGRWPLSREYSEAPEYKLSAIFQHYKRTTFRYATGAAYCISSHLMEKLEPYCRGSQLGNNCDGMGYPDDVLIGAVIGAVLGFDLTSNSSINTSLNGHKGISKALLKYQITISYGEFRFSNREPVKNVVLIPDAAFSEEDDPTRFLSYHCLVYPQTRWCRT